jgi:hypothetical protein
MIRMKLKIIVICNSTMSAYKFCVHFNFECHILTMFQIVQQTVKDNSI